LGAGFMYSIGFPTPIINFLVGVVIAAVMGYLFMKVDMPKLYIFGLTAFSGASAMISGIIVLFGRIPPSQLGLSFINAFIAQSWFWVLVWVILGSLGFFVQYQLVKLSQTMVPEAYSYEFTKKELEQKAKKSK
jgi:membrane-bound ClpP family serine protease